MEKPHFWRWLSIPPLTNTQVADVNLGRSTRHHLVRVARIIAEIALDGTEFDHGASSQVKHFETRNAGSI